MAVSVLDDWLSMGWMNGWPVICRCSWDVAVCNRVLSYQFSLVLPALAFELQLEVCFQVTDRFRVGATVSISSRYQLRLMARLETASTASLSSRQPVLYAQHIFNCFTILIAQISCQLSSLYVCAVL